MKLTTISITSSTKFKTYVNKYPAIEFDNFTMTLSNCLNFLVQKSAITSFDKMTLQKNQTKAFEIINKHKALFIEL